MSKMGVGSELRSSSVRLKWSQNETKVIGLLDLEVDVIRVHYADKQTYLCYQEQNLPCPFCKKGEFRYRLGANVLLYSTRIENGQLVFDGKYELKIWTFGQDAYQELYRLKKSWPLENHDLEVTCTNEQFQTLSIQIRPESMWKKGALGDASAIRSFYDSNKKDVGQYMLSQVVLPGQQPRARRQGPLPASTLVQPTTQEPSAGTVKAEEVSPVSGLDGGKEIDSLLDSL